MAGKVNEHVKERKTSDCLSLSTPQQVNLALTLIKQKSGPTCKFMVIRDASEIKFEHPK